MATKFTFTRLSYVWSIIITQDDNFFQLILEDLSKIKLLKNYGIVEIYISLPGTELVSLQFRVSENLEEVESMFKALGIRID